MRPVEYKEEYVAKADEYLSTCGVQKDEEGNPTGYSLPKIEGFARFIDVNKSTLYDWGERFPVFSDALEKIRIEQHNQLVDRGLTGAFNSTITKLMLSSNHGYREKTDLTSGGDKIQGATLVIPPDSAVAIMGALHNWGLMQGETEEQTAIEPATEPPTIEHATTDQGTGTPSDTQPAN